ncbi:hypothetical protein PC9H_009900 [Pleurotus ostreatus]|uniref:F-box domain-containing protein n=1 Tax=Pleurotus ostreatus TaxID=5322 RepID=A0A8H6ZPX6_PLEOS|nr:uncharacterized protein PC9H_009900 [Pleurotus ostreatus]KAF7424592.1 hypothetical protein PC9H_009900 [Pleurotus ostreatus]KAJ8692440.1 hypothetical protein PTI98_009751 [Pleurotus ostreatus]
MYELPPELIFLILRELRGYRGALEKCSLVCSAWREICIPFLFHDLRLFDSPSRIRAYRLLMFHAPHLRPHVQKLTLLSPSMVMGEADSKSDEERELLLSLIEALPKLNTLHSDVYSWTDDWCLRIPRCSSITALHIWDPYALTANTPPWLLKLLRETADTLRSLSLGGLFFKQVSLEGAVDGRVALPYPMNALEALRIQTCYNLPFHPEVITMPNLQVLECRKHRQMAFCESLPASLKTLVVDTAFSGGLPISAENVCLIGERMNNPSALLALSSLHSPTKIKHLELFLSRWIQITPHYVPISSEVLDFVLDLCQNGSLQEFIVTFSEGDPRESMELDDKLSKLESLGVLNLRIGLPSQLLPAGSHSYYI